MNHLNNLIERYPKLAPCKESILHCYERLAESFAEGGRLYTCGNGGSASDALHIVGELVKSFVLPRSIEKSFEMAAGEEMSRNFQGALPAFALVENTSLTTAYANDVSPDYVFAQQVYAYARPGDCVLGLSTSGNSTNVLNALRAARCRGAVALGLTGRDGGAMKDACDVCIVVPEMETYKIQELHLPVYHCLCMMVEERFWGK